MAVSALDSIRRRQEWQFFAALPKADTRLAVAWWAVVLLRGILPAAFAISMGVLVAAVQRGDPLGVPLVAVGVVFVLLQMLTPIHTADQRQPRRSDRGMALRPPHRSLRAARRAWGTSKTRRSTSDLTVARDFDLGMTGPPLSYLDGLHRRRPGRDDRRARRRPCVLFAFAWWAPLVLAGAWLATHWLLRESGVWRDRNTDEVRSAQRDADYAYRLAVDPPASKELRLFGLVGLDDRSLRRPAHAPAPAAVRGDAAARAAGRCGACC